MEQIAEAINNLVSVIGGLTLAFCIWALVDMIRK